MRAMAQTPYQRCRACLRPFTSWRRLQHHWAAEHAPRTLEDIRKTFLHIHKTGDLMRVYRLRLRGRP